MKKRLLVILLILCMVLSMFSFAIPNSTIKQVENGVPVFISGDLTAASNEEASAIIINYLNENKSNLKVKENNAFKVNKVEKQKDFTVVRLQQTINNTPVYGYDQVATIDDSGVLKVLAGKYFDAQKVISSKKVNANKAIDIALADLTITPVFEEGPTSELVYYVDHNEAKLTYVIELNYLDPEAARWFYFVDAANGQILNKFNSLDSAKPVKPVVGTPIESSGIDVKGDLRTFTALKSATYYLQDTTRGGGIYTYNGANATRLPGTLWSDIDNFLNAAYDAPAVSAHANVSNVYDFFLTEYNRNSFNGNGAALKSTVHYSRKYNNAFWNGNQMVFGDGDGNVFYPLSGALDVVAHELTHAVTEYTCDLIYQNESGATNEALSDIIGTRVEFYYNDDPDYLIGEDISGPGLGSVALRSMANPTLMGDPDHYSQRYTGTQDNGGVHSNSGIINKAAYLMAEGGNHYGVAVNGIGIDKTSDIFYRCMTNYLTASSNFSNLKVAAIQAATDLYGASSPEVSTVIKAFNAVGVQ